MQRRTPLALAATTLAILALGACAASSDPAPPPEAVRAIVLAESPLELVSDQQDVVTWPIWGGAFTPDETVTLRGSLEPGGTGASGLVIAGAGEPEERVAVEIVGSDGTWTARETGPAGPVQGQELEGQGKLVIEVGAEGGEVAITVGDGEPVTLELAEPLAPAGDAAGVYAYLEPGASLDITELSSSQPLPSREDLGTPLREAAAEGGTRIGTALDIWPPLHDIQYEAMLGEQFNAATPTEFYWATTRGEDEDYFFIPADLSVNYATVHDLEVTGMFLVWDFELPGWVQDIAASGDADALDTVYDDHITTLVSRYAETVDSWVVVNEGIWGPQDTGGTEAEYAQTVWYDMLGEEHIERAFRAADAADPDSVLMYNETGAEEVNGKSDFMYDMVADLLTRDVPIDAVGLQFHIDATNPPDMDSARENMQRFADLGLEVYVTELDVSIPEQTEEQLALQAQIYGDVVAACVEVEGCHGTTVFGFSDRYSWDELGEATPLLFDVDYQPKPAVEAVRDALSGEAR